MAVKRHSIGLKFTGDDSDLRATVTRTERDIDKYASSVDRANRQANAGSASHRKYRDSTRDLGSSMGVLTRAVGALGGAYGAWRALNAADDFKLLESRVALATEKTGGYAETLDEVYRISQDNGVALKSTVDLYTNIARSAEELGKSNSDVLEFSETVQQLGITSGATGEQMDRAMMQMGQSFAGGIVRAEEFNSILENTPGIAQAMAAGLGMSLGEVRQKMLAGQLTAEEMFNAIISQSDEAQRKFDKFPLSINRSTTAFKTSTTRIVSMFDEIFDATGTVSGGIKSLSDSLDNISADELESLANTAKTAGVAIGSLMVARTAAPMIAALGTAAFTSAGHVRTLNAAMGLMGGPIGIAITALGGLAYAFVNAREKAESLRAEVSEAEFTRPNASIQELKKSLSAVEGVMANLEKATGKTSAAYKQQESNAGLLRKQIEGLEKAEADKTKEIVKSTTATGKASVSVKKFGTDQKDAAANAKKLKAEVKAEDKAFNDLMGTLYPLEKEFDKFSDDLNILGKRFAKGELSADAYSDAVYRLEVKQMGLTDETENASKAIKEQGSEFLSTEKEIDDFIRSIDGAYDKERKLEEQTNKLQQAAFELGWTEEKLAAELNKATAEVHNFGEAADPTALLWENAVKRIDDSFAGLFRSMFDGGLDSFDDFGDELLDMTKDLAAEWAYSMAKGVVLDSNFGQGVMSSLGGVNPLSLLTGGAGLSQSAMLASQTAGFGLEGMAMTAASASYASGATAVGGFSSAVSAAIPPLAALAGVAAVVSLSQKGSWKSRGTLLDLNYSGGDFTGQQTDEMKRKGGLFHSNDWRTDVSALSDEMNSYIDTALSDWSIVALDIGTALNPNGIATQKTGFARLSAMLRGAPTEYMKSVENVIYGVFNVDTIDVTGLDAEEVQEKLDAWVTETGAMLLSAVMPDFAGTIQAGAADGVLEDMLAPLKDIGTFLGAELVPQVTATLTEQIAVAETHLSTVAAGYDGSLATVQAMGAAVSQELALRQQMTNYLAAAAESVSAAFAGTSEQIWRDITPIADQYAQADDHVKGLLQSLVNGGTPETVTSIAAELNKATQDAWRTGVSKLQEEQSAALSGLTDPAAIEATKQYFEDARVSLGEKLRETLDDADEITQTHLEKARLANDQRLREEQAFVREHVVNVSNLQIQAANAAAAALIAAANRLQSQPVQAPIIYNYENTVDRDATDSSNSTNRYATYDDYG